MRKSKREENKSIAQHSAGCAILNDFLDALELIGSKKNIFAQLNDPTPS